MTISTSKIRMSLVIEKSDKLRLEKIAKAQERSVNYCINKAIKKYLEENRSSTEQK